MTHNEPGSESSYFQKSRNKPQTNDDVPCNTQPLETLRFVGTGL